MMRPSLLLLAFSVLGLEGCARTEVVVLFGARSVEGEIEPGAFLMVSQPFGKRGVCSYLHTSNPVRGVPFDDRDEINLDGGMCGIRWGKPQ
jgi:hypothetical protein